MADTRRVFRLSLLRFWLWAGLLYGVCVSVLYLLIRFSGRVLDPAALAAATAGVAVVLGVVGLTYRVEVTGEGVRFLDLQGEWRFLAWGQIEWAERSRFVGLPLLELKVSGLPGRDGVVLLLRDLPGFKAAVTAAAGPSHPATWALLG
jgi:hypothetical protein